MANRRVLVLIGLVSLLALFALGILFNLQILDGQSSGIYGSNSRGEPFIRNTVFFQDKRSVQYPAATTIKQYNFFISPRDLGDLEETYSHISSLIDIDFDDFAKLASKEDDAYEVLKKNITPQEREKIDEYLSSYSVPGVHFEKIKQRHYPYKELAAHLLGFVGFSNKGEYTGQYGLEKIYNNHLSNPRNNALKRTIQQEALLHSLLGGSVSNGEVGGDIVTTIDPFVQEHLEKELANIMKVWRTKKVGGIITRPGSGEIVAMGALPSYDPNKFNTITDYSVFTNPLISNVYEIGSIFKPLTLAIGLDSGSIDIDETYNDTGRIFLDRRYISNYDGKARGEGTTLQEFINDSLNLGAVHIVQETGIEIFRSYLLSFFFDTPTGVDLPVEVGGLINNLESNRTIEYATAAYGQGIAVTPLGIVRALSSLANGGILKQPYIVDFIDTGEERVNNPLKDGDDDFRIFDSKTTQEVTKILIKGFDEALLGGTLRDKSYTIASKTGTASIPDPVNGGYYEDKVLHTFFGYFPATRPEYFIFLFAEEPQWPQAKDNEFVLYSSSTLPHPFKSIVDYLAAYYEVVPDRLPTQ